MANTNIPGFDSSELKELKQKLVDGCHILDREGITDSFGHVSLRIPGTDAFLTIAGVSPGCATVNRLIMLDLDGHYLGGDKAAPYEWPIHARILRARPDVISVCHTHSKWSALFSVLKGSLSANTHVREVSSRRGSADLSGGRLDRHDRTGRSAGDRVGRQQCSFVTRAWRCGRRRKPRRSDPAHYPACLYRRACASGRRAWRTALYERGGVGDFFR